MMTFIVFHQLTWKMTTVDLGLKTWKWLIFGEWLMTPLFRWRQQKGFSSPPTTHLRRTLWGLVRRSWSQSWLRRLGASSARPVGMRWTFFFLPFWSWIVYLEGNVCFFFPFSSLFVNLEVNMIEPRSSQIKDEMERRSSQINDMVMSSSTPRCCVRCAHWSELFVSSQDSHWPEEFVCSTNILSFSLSQDIHIVTEADLV